VAHASGHAEQLADEPSLISNFETIIRNGFELPKPEIENDIIPSTKNCEKFTSDILS
jgi:hypothetical protein